MSTSPVNYNLQNLYGQSGPQNLFGAGSNQYGGGWPTYQSPTPSSYSVPSSGSYQAQTPSLSSQPGGYYTGTTYDPQLTSSLFGYLGSQVGQGLPTYPGQLTAAPNQLYGQLGSLLTGGQSNLPYGQQMLNMAQTGAPTDVGPAWEAMIKASQQNIEQNQAQLKEQFAAGGNLVGTPYGTAMQDYMSQTALGENAILTQAQQQAAEAAAGRQLQAQQGLTSADLALGGNLQQIAQQGATNAYNEWLRTQPQYNPLLGQAYGGATTFPPYLNPQQSPWAMIIPAILNMFGPGGLKIPGLPSGGSGGGGSKQPTDPTKPGGGTQTQTQTGNVPWWVPTDINNPPNIPLGGGQFPNLPPYNPTIPPNPTTPDTGNTGTSISYDPNTNQPILVDRNGNPVDPYGTPPGFQPTDINTPPDIGMSGGSFPTIGAGQTVMPNPPTSLTPPAGTGDTSTSTDWLSYLNSNYGDIFGGGGGYNVGGGDAMNML